MRIARSDRLASLISQMPMCQRRFADEKAHEAHRQSPHFKAFMQLIEEGAMLENPIEIIGGPIVGGFAIEDVSF